MKIFNADTAKTVEKQTNFISYCILNYLDGDLWKLTLEFHKKKKLCMPCLNYKVYDSYKAIFFFLFWRKLINLSWNVCKMYLSWAWQFSLSSWIKIKQIMKFVKMTISMSYKMKCMLWLITVNLCDEEVFANLDVGNC